MEKFGKESIGCEYCPGGYGMAHEDWCPNARKKQKKKPVPKD